MTQVTGKYFLITKLSSTTFSLQDQDGTDIDSAAYTTFTSGTCSRVTEIDTPYRADLDLFVLKKAQTKDLMYIDHPYYEPRVLTRSGHNAWSLDRYTRTNDPFWITKTVSAVTIADPAVVTTGTHNYVSNEIIILDEIVGTVGTDLLNGQPFLITVLSSTTFSLQDVVTGVDVDSSGLAYSSAGVSANQNLIPSCVALFQGRAWHAGMFAFPQRFWASRAPDGPADPDPGAPNYDDFTTGSVADDAFSNAISDSEVNAILWLTATDDFLMAGTFGSETKLTGSTSGSSMTPTSVKAVPMNSEGVADIQGINKKNHVFYVQSGGLDVTALRFEFERNAQVPQDLNLISDNVTKSGVKKMAWQSGRPDIMWYCLNNGGLSALTFEPVEGIQGWHQHDTGTSAEDKFLTVSTMERPDNRDQVWAIIERTINGTVRREVAYKEDAAVIPERLDYFTGDANEVADTAKFLRAMAEAQKEYVHLDSALTYDGTARGSTASATLTPSALTGTTITFTASAAVFLAADDDSGFIELRKKSIDGVGKGRARMKTFSSSTVVLCDIIEDFDVTTAMAAGDWYFTTSSLSGLDHLEGRAIGICGDGSPIEGKTVSSGAVTLGRQVSKAHAGLLYEGLLIPMALEFGGTTGPSVGRNKVIIELGLRLLNTLGAEVGTDIYNPQIMSLTKMPIQVGNPSPLFTGIERVPFNDTWESDKIAYVKQRKPLPCTVQTMVIYGETEES